MADISGASLSIARPIVNNNGVNQQRELENQETDQRLRATSAPQQGREINQEPSDVPPEESISSRLDISVSANENTTQENTTVTREQVVLAVEQQLQQSSINANAERAATTPTDTAQATEATAATNPTAAATTTEFEQSTAESTSNQTSNQTSEQLAADRLQTAQQQESTNETVETPVAGTDQDVAATPTQNQPTDTTQNTQPAGQVNVEPTAETTETETEPNQTEQPSSRNPEAGLGLESGSIIDTIA